MGLKSERLLLSSKEIADFLKKTLKKEIPFKFTAKGTSMSPFICSGDSLIIEPVLQNRSIEEGDIVAIITPEEGYLIVHRIIRKNRHYLLKGDNVYPEDGYYSQTDIHGYVGKIIIARKYSHGYRKTIRYIFLFFNKFKKMIAFLSRYKILTPVCRLTNKVLNG